MFQLDTNIALFDEAEKKNGANLWRMWKFVRRTHLSTVKTNRQFAIPSAHAINPAKQNIFRNILITTPLPYQTGKWRTAKQLAIGSTAAAAAAHHTHSKIMPRYFY